MFHWLNALGHKWGGMMQVSAAKMARMVDIDMSDVPGFRK